MTASPEDWNAKIQQNLDVIWQRIEAAGGSKNSITLVAVSKKFPVDVVTAACKVGLVDFGENYSQELVAKSAELSKGEALRWHFIGGLQRNKVKHVAGLVSVWHTVDRESLATEIAKRSAGASIFVQVNTTDEEQKSGCSLGEAPQLVDFARTAGLDVKGLMTMGPSDGSDPRRCFETLRTLNERLGLDELSMGMSADYELAIAEGSSMVRIGSAIFGSRPA